jgi:hypothetical protein
MQPVVLSTLRRFLRAAISSGTEVKGGAKNHLPGHAETPGKSRNHPVPLSGEKLMNLKINEDWLSVIVAFGLIALALIGVIAPTWMKF